MGMHKCFPAPRPWRFKEGQVIILGQGGPLGVYHWYRGWKDGNSLGACVALALAARLVERPPRDDLIGVSATVDLRGRLSFVGGLDLKAGHARKRGLKWVVICPRDYRLLAGEEPPFSSIPGDDREYAKAHFVQAETMLPG